MFIRHAFMQAALVAGLCSQLAADNRPPESLSLDASRNSAVADLKTDQKTIRTLVRQLGSVSESERIEAKQKLLKTGRLAVGVLWEAAETPSQPLADLARELLAELPRSGIQLRDAMDQPIKHSLVEFFEVGPHSIQLKDEPFAYGFTDLWGGLHLPEPPQPESPIALRVKLVERGITTITRLSPGDLKQIRAKHPRFHFDHIFLPVLPQDSPHADRAVCGIVQDSAGQPVADAEVSCEWAASPALGLVGAFRRVELESSVVTDHLGRFRFYFPNWHYHPKSIPRDFIPRIPPQPIVQTEPLPEDIQYSLIVRVPRDLTYSGTLATREVESVEAIELQHTDVTRRFEFEALDGSLISDEARLSAISLWYQPPGADALNRSDGWPWIKVDQRIVLYGGPIHSGWYYSSYEAANGDEVRSKVVRIKNDSPDVIRMPAPPPVVFRGRVVDGSTGKPLAGAFVAVVDGRRSGASLADVTDDEWAAAEQLPLNPKLNASAVQPLQRVSPFKTLVRTDSLGAYALRQEPDGRFYGVFVLARNYLPTSVRLYKGEFFHDVPDLQLFPAATIRLRNGEKDGPFTVDWDSLPDGQPEWYVRMTDYTRNLLHHEVQLNPTVGTSGVSLEPGETRSLLVPAGLRFTLTGNITGHRPRIEDPRRASGVRHSSAFVERTPMLLKPGQNIDCGDVSLVPATTIQVQVVGPDGEPVPGAPVSQTHKRDREELGSWHGKGKTDIRGFIPVNIHPATTQLTLGVSGGDVFAPDHFMEKKTINWPDAPQQKPIQIQLSAEQVKIVESDFRNGF